MKHELEPLSYAMTALEPYLDARTLTLHHDLHHAGYVDALNLVLESAPDLLKDKTAEWLLLNLEKVPQKIRTAVRNNAGGHVNHSLYWHSMTPAGSGAVPEALADAIDDGFGSFENFKSEFEAAGLKLFGSGWVWLVKPQRGDRKLRIVTTAGHDHPLVQGLVPLLLNDVWEHAYYLKFENRRAEYLKSWWPLVHWKAVARRLERAQPEAPLLPDMKGEGFTPDSRRSPDSGRLRL